MRLVPSLSFAASLGLVASCNPFETERVKTGHLCVAANPAEVFELPADPDGPDDRPTRAIYVEEKSEIRIGKKKGVPIPNEQVAFRHLPEGTVLAFVAGTETVHSSVIDYDEHGKRLCLYYRRYKDKTLTGGWILDADREGDRCTCD